MSTLALRIITALVLAPLALAAVWFLPPAGFRLFVAALLLVGTFEYRALADLNPVAGRFLVGVQFLILVLMSLAWGTLSNHALALLAAGSLAWCIMLLRLVTYRDRQVPDAGYRIVGFASALASVTFAWFAVSWLHQLAGGRWLILLLFLLVWAADIGAYFAGRSLGRTPLAPTISPKKTWEGLLGGLLLSAGLAWLAVRQGGWHDVATLPLLAVFLVTILVSVGGDLYISLQKRTVGLKDTGKIFPGHGGVFDRLDSLVASAPFFALGIYFLRS